MYQHGLSVGTQSASLSGAPATGNIELTREMCARLAIQPCAATAGTYVEFNAWVERLPSDFAESVIGGLSVASRDGSHISIERWVRDNFRKIYVSYAVTVEQLPQPGTYRVSFSSSHAPAPDDVAKAKSADWKIASPPLFPVPQIFQEGDELRLALTDDGSGAQLADYLHIGSPGNMPKRKEAARDSYAEDAEFALASPTLRVNGDARPAISFPETFRGQILWLYVPGQGRYILSFLPHAQQGFSKTGEVAGNLMTLFTREGTVLRVSSHDRIAPGGGVYNVYGTRDPTWQPADPAERDRFMAGTSPAVETALPH